MKWFNNWITKKYQKIQNIGKLEGMPISVDVNRLQSPGMSFSIHRANGGYVVENRKYDLKFDRSEYNLHVITDDKDLGEELGKIVTYENIRM
jgi:hypothetical protein